jgi:hypothetical protein
MKKEEVLGIVGYVNEISNYQWVSFGKGNKIWSFCDTNEDEIGGFVSDGEKVFSVEFIYEDFKNGSVAYRWIDPLYREAYSRDCIERNIDEKMMNEEIRYIDLEVESDCLTKLKAICEHKDFNKDIVVELDISDETFLAIAKTAHENNITFNEQVVNLIKDEVERRKALKK